VQTSAPQTNNYRSGVDDRKAL